MATFTFTFFKTEDGQDYWLDSKYDPDFVADLKSELEWWERKWDRDRKLWRISHDAFRRAAEVCQRYGNVKFRDDGPDDPERQRQAKAQEQRRATEEARRQATEEARRQREQWSRDQQWRTPPRTSSVGCPYQTLHLQPGAPLEVVRAAYRALALKWHPDKGGDDEKMKRINAAHDTIMRQRGERK